MANIKLLQHQVQRGKRHSPNPEKTLWKPKCDKDQKQPTGGKAEICRQKAHTDRKPQSEAYITGRT
ncbi:putative nipped-B-like protein isoform X2 [Sesbania bispinosa]|nr:putative nipped-B-like protein isoform X2 [Sesbania bispinosa]